MTASTPLLITFTVYILAMLGIGVFAWWRTHNLSDYILGGRSLGSFVVALAAGASDMSGWLLLGLPGAVYLAGVSESWLAIGLIIGAYLNWKLVAARLRVYTERTRNALTLPDYFTHRFADRSRILRVFSALVILVFFAIYAASGVVAGARLFESIFGISYTTALWVGAAATIAYTLIGGFLAVSWTDTVQATLMIFALLITPLTVVYLQGGLPQSLALVEQVGPDYLQMFRGTTFVGIISLLAWGLGYFGQPHILARFMAAESAAAIPAARRIGMTWMILCLGGAVAVGLFGISWFSGHPDQAALVTQNPERVFIVLVQVLFNPWIGGVLLSAILAAIMSTLSAQLLVCASALTEDFYRAMLRNNAGQRELVWVGRITVLLVALLAIAMAADPESRVLGLVSYAWAGFGAAFGPVVLLSLMWPRMTRDGALAGMLVGAATVLVWKQYEWLGLYEIIPGFAFATVAIVAVSVLGRAPSDDVRATFDAVDAEMRALRPSLNVAVAGEG